MALLASSNPRERAGLVSTSQASQKGCGGLRKRWEGIKCHILPVTVCSAALHQWPHGSVLSNSAHTGPGLVCGWQVLCRVWMGLWWVRTVLVTSQCKRAACVWPMIWSWIHIIHCHFTFSTPVVVQFMMGWQWGSMCNIRTLKLK